MIALLNLSVFGFSFVVFHDKTHQGNLIAKETFFGFVFVYYIYLGKIWKSDTRRSDWVMEAEDPADMK